MKNIVFLFGFLIPFLALGQKDTLVRKKAIHLDTEYILNYSDQLNVKFFGILKSNQVGHFDNWTKKYVYYRPNENFNIGFGVSHHWLSFDLALNLPFINDDNEIYGSTKRFDIQANVYLRRFTIDFNYQRYKGYYGSNAAVYIPGFDIQNPDFPIRPDMSTFNTAANLIYIFKPEKFSYRAAFVFNERQLKSAGSWLVGSYLSKFKMDADSTIIPDILKAEFNPDADFRKTRYVNIGIGGGYGHTFVISSKTFFSVTVVLGFGPAFINSPQVDNIPERSIVRLAARASIRMSLGYNSERFFAGISTISHQTSEVDPLESRLERNFNHFKIFVGKRFGAPKFLDKMKKK